MEKLEEAVDSFEDIKRVAVIGDLILDEFLYGIIERTNPEDPIAHVVKLSEERKVALGGAGNVGKNIISLNTNCDLYSFIGNDSYGEELEKLCRNTLFPVLEKLDKPTFVKQRIIVQNNRQAIRLDHGEYHSQKPSSNEYDFLLEKIRLGLKSRGYNGIILSDYNKLMFNKDIAQSIISLANEMKIPTLVDPKPENIDCFKGCTIVRPNEKEAEKITGIHYSNGKNVLEKMATALIERVDAKYVFITCGADGVFCYNNSGEKHMIPTRARKVWDPTGAGDTFAATLMLGHVSGLDMKRAGELANYAAGIVVESPGTIAISKEELIKRIRQDYNK